MNTVLNLIDQHTEEEIKDILDQSFYAFLKGTTTGTFSRLKKKLEKLEYISEGKLTAKGQFASKIYADEILLSEIFATEFYEGLNEYKILMTLACISYEPREMTRFFKRFPSEFSKELNQQIYADSYIGRDKRFENIDKLTALIHPCYYGKSIFDVIENTNLLEGDVIRLFRQILDRLGQLKKATEDKNLRNMLNGCQDIISTCMKDIDVV